MIRLWNSWEQIQRCAFKTRPTNRGRRGLWRDCKDGTYYFLCGTKAWYFSLTHRERGRDVQITFHGCKQKSPGPAASHVTIIFSFFCDGDVVCSWHRMLHIIFQTESTENAVLLVCFWWKFSFASIAQVEQSYSALISWGWGCSSSPTLQQHLSPLMNIL